MRNGLLVSFISGFCAGRTWSTSALTSLALVAEWLAWCTMLVTMRVPLRKQVNAIAAAAVLLFANPFYFGSHLSDVEFGLMNDRYFIVRSVQSLFALLLMWCCEASRLRILSLPITILAVAVVAQISMLAAWLIMRWHHKVHAVQLSRSPRRASDERRCS